MKRKYSKKLLTTIAILFIVIVVIFGGVFCLAVFLLKPPTVINAPQFQNPTAGRERNNQRERLLIKDLLGYWGEVDSSKNDINCGYEYEFSIDDKGFLIYNLWNHCRPMDSGTWSIEENVLSFKRPDDFTYSNNFKINGNYLDLDAGGYFKRITGDPSIDQATKESLQSWEDLINK